MKNKKTKIILGIIIAVILLAISITLVNYLPMLLMTPVETGEVEGTDIIAVRNNKNDIYFMNTEDGYIMIDAGSDKDTIIESMKNLSIAPDQIKYIFITHTHYDHIAAIDQFPNAVICLNEKENKIAGNLQFVENDEKINVGSHTVECLAAPGHTLGSMLYLVDDAYLFTGDAFKVSKSKLSLHPYTTDKEAAQNNISNLNEILDRTEIMLTAHYGVYSSETVKSLQH